VVATLILVAWDIYVALTDPSATFTVIVQDLNERSPAIPWGFGFVLGFVSGHLWFGGRSKRK
jgi:hypothetical protein